MRGESIVTFLLFMSAFLGMGIIISAIVFMVLGTIILEGFSAGFVGSIAGIF